MASSERLGTVLIDNTTVFAAQRAYDTWPISIEEWFNSANSANIRSLMDIIEAIILNDRLLVDASSRGLEISDVSGKYQSIWPELEQLRDKKVGVLRRFFDILDNNDEELILKQEYLGRDLYPSLVLAALNKLSEHLDKGSFSDNLKKFQQSNLDLIVPVFYRNSGEFSELLLKSLGNYAQLLSLQSAIENVEKKLNTFEFQIANYAMFAFRGFFYQQVAFLNGISYLPHTWRSSILDLDTDTSRINFLDYIKEELGEIRQEMAQKLNSEFGNVVFRSDFPILASYVANQCKSRKMLLDTALEIRNTRAAQTFRKWVRGIEYNIKNEQDLAAINRAQEELHSIVKDIKNIWGYVRKRKIKKSKSSWEYQSFQSKHHCN